MISQTLKNKIEDSTKRIINQNPFFVHAREGRIKRDQIAFYLRNLRFAFSQSVLFFEMAHVKSKKDVELAAFFKEKIVEETGHDQWAVDDLKVLGFEVGDIEADDLSDSLRDLVHYLQNLILEDPRMYFCYITIAEYFTVLATPTLVDDLEKNCSIPRNALTAITKHEEADKEHTEEDFRAIDKFIEGQVDENSFFDVYDICFDYIERFLYEIANREHPCLH